MGKVVKLDVLKRAVPPNKENGKIEHRRGCEDSIFYSCENCGCGLNYFYELRNGHWECPYCSDVIPPYC